MVQGHALKKVLGYATPAVFSIGAMFREAGDTHLINWQ